MEYKHIIITKDGDGIAVVTLNRPKALNALNSAVANELAKAGRALEEDNDVKAVIVTGAGRAFAAGADIKELQKATPSEARKWARNLFDSFDALARISKPVIAAVNGIAFGGGCELALACDYMIASEKAIFGVPEIKIGVFPGAGGMYRLAKVVGMRMAKEMIFNGEPVDAKTALSIGLINRILPADNFLEDVKVMVRKIASMSGIALKLAKQALDEGQDAPDPMGVYRDIDALGIAFATEDQKEGMAAFVEKRPPKFVNK